jgi:hypothetical protein
MDWLLRIAIIAGYVLVSYLIFPRLARFSLGKGPEADLARLATRGQDLGAFGTMKTTPILELLLIVLMLPGFLVARIVVAVIKPRAP